jgi:RNA polymerase sigma-70 factor (ECF subfamily)
MANLQAELHAAGKGKLFHHLRPHLQGDRSGRPYAEVATELGLSEGAVKVAIHRLRKRYGELLRSEVARTVDASEDVDTELHHLIEVASG